MAACLAVKLDCLMSGQGDAFCFSAVVVVVVVVVSISKSNIINDRNSSSHDSNNSCNSKSNTSRDGNHVGAVTVDTAAKAVSL